jgi:hypothetical protein
MMQGMTSGARMNGSIAWGSPGTPARTPQIDGALTLIDKIRVLEDRRMAAFEASPAGRRRLLHRMHEQAALAAEPARQVPVS